MDRWERATLERNRRSAAWVWIAMLAVVAVLMLVAMTSSGGGSDASGLPACTASSDYPCRDGAEILARAGDGSVQRLSEADWLDSLGGDNGPAWDELAH